MAFLREATSATVIASTLLAALEIGVVSGGGAALGVVETLHSGGGGNRDRERDGEEKKKG